jgi:hypothetical protein
MHADRSGDQGQERRSLPGLAENVIVGRLIPGGTELPFHCARKEKEAWEPKGRQALLQQKKANMAAALQAPSADTACRRCSCH